MALIRGGARAFTLVEVMIGLLLVSAVFLGAGSVYLSSLKFLKTAQTNDITTTPMVSLELVSKKISLANQATVTGGQLDLRADYPVCGDFTTPNGGTGTPSNFGDDNYWHYQFINGALRTVCDNAAGTIVGNGDTIAIPSVNTGTSSFSMVNPSGAGSSTVVAIHLVTTVPVATLDTRVAVGAEAKG